MGMLDYYNDKNGTTRTPSQQAGDTIKSKSSGMFDYYNNLSEEEKKKRLKQNTPAPSVAKAPETKVAQTPTQDKGFDLGGFLGNLGDTIKKAISTAIPQANQVQPEVDKLKKDIAGVDLTGAQPQQSVTPTGTPSAQLQSGSNSLLSNGQQKVKNIIDSVIKYNPKTVQPAVNQLDNLRNILIKEFPQTATRINELVTKKADLDSTGAIRKSDKGNVAGVGVGKHVLTDMYNAVMPTLVDGVRRAYEDKLPSKNIAETVGKKIAVVTGATNIAFTPISAFFAAIENFPVIGKIAGAVSLPFAAVGEGATKFSDTLIDNLFVSNPEVKNAIKRPVGEAFALASQIALGKAMHITEQKAVSTIKNVGIETFTKLTKNISEQSGQPTVYNISPAEVRKIATIGSKSVEANILRDLGLSGDEWSNAAKKGISVQVSPEKVVGIVDKPYFAKIKSLLKIEPVDTIKTIPGNASVRGNFAGSLPEHILTPEQAIAQADGTNLSGTPAGISMKEAAIKAQSEGKNIKVELTNTKDGLTTPEGTRVKYTIVNEQAPIQKMTGEKPGEVKTQPTTLEELIKIKQPTLEQVKLINKLRGEQMAQTGGKSAENIAEVKMGWKPDQKDAFDRALSTGDKATVEKMLPDVPQDFKDKFSKEIEQVMSGVKSETPTKAIDPLLSEAKKYKSAEEFIRKEIIGNGEIRPYKKGDFIGSYARNDSDRALYYKGKFVEFIPEGFDKKQTENFLTNIIKDKEGFKSQLTDIWNQAQGEVGKVESKLTPNLKVVDAYGKTNMGYNIQGMEKRANETGYNLYDALIKRVDSQTTVEGKRVGMESILDDLYGESREVTQQISDIQSPKPVEVKQPQYKDAQEYMKSIDKKVLDERVKQYKTVEEFVNSFSEELNGLTFENINRNLPQPSGAPINADVALTEIDKVKKMLADFYNEQNSTEVSVPREQIPVGEGEKKASKLEARMKGVIGDATPEQIDALGLSTSDTANNDQQLKDAAEYVTNNKEDALRVLKGEIPAPKGLLENAIFVAMTKMADTDITLATKLVGLASKRHGQEIQILSQIEPHSLVNILNTIYDIREKAFKKKYGNRTVKEVTKNVVESIKKNVKKIDKNDWANFIDSIETC